MNNTNPTLNEWLESIGLEQYGPEFEKHAVTLELLATLTDEDLKDCGVAALGHRKQILNEILRWSGAAVEAPASYYGNDAASDETAAPEEYIDADIQADHDFEAEAGPTIPEPRMAAPLYVTPIAEQADATHEEEWQQTVEQPVVVANSRPSKRKLFAGKFLLVSIAVHLLLGVGAAYIIVQRINSKRKVTFQGGPPSVNPNKRALEHKMALGAKKKSGGAPAQAKRIATTGLAKISLPEMPTIAVTNEYTPGKMAGMGGTGFGTGMGNGMGSGGGMGGGGGGGGGFNMLPPTLKSRCSSTERLAKLIQSGGNAKCEEAVTLSLDWLKGAQNADGSWGTSHKAAMTGFALLCYFGRCITPDNPKYGENVMKGILYLIELSKKGGNGVITSDPQPQGSTIYEHGIATYALGEMYALARMGRKELPGMREAFEAGVNFILNNQLANGGWRYYTGSYDKGGAADLSVTGWQYQALKAAKLTALPIPRLHEGTMKAIEYLKSTQNRTKGAGFITGGFGNTGLGAGYNQWSLSGVSILGLQTLGTGGSSTTAINNGIKFASDFYKKTPPDWGTNCNLYAWYYYSQAFYQQGGSDWKQWNDTAMAQVQNNQNSDGTWKAEGACPANSVGTSHAGGDATIYRTCLCTLMLEVYYRYLKVSDH